MSFKLYSYKHSPKKTCTWYLTCSSKTDLTIIFSIFSEVLVFFLTSDYHMT